MRYYQLETDTGPRLIVRDDTNAYDLTSQTPKLTSFADLVSVASIVNDDVDALSRDLLSEAERVDTKALTTDANQPIHPDEVWAAGVTYQISEQARENESEMPDLYLNVYEGDRPEIFFKATPNRTVGPNDPVGIRQDSDWNVPEPELGVVLSRGTIVGYTVGNDMSSRSIEGTNPLYLPQAKVYEKCCSIGPCVVSADSIDPHDLTISMRIRRGSEILYEEQTSTNEMVRTVDELVSFYERHNSLPEFSVLLTGTSLVPDEDITLREGDQISIEIENIGTLTNTVTVV